MVTKSAHDVDRAAAAQASRNFMANVGVFGAQTAVALLFTPYLMAQLGVPAYGLIPLANTLASYGGILALSLQGSVGRMLTLAVRRRETARAQEIFNTAWWLLVVVTCLLGVLLSTVALWATSVFAIPDEVRGVATAFFFVSFGAYLIDVLRSVFMTAGITTNRLDVMNLGPLAEVAIRPVITVAAFSLGVVSVVVVSWGWLIGAVAALVISFLLSRRLAPDLSIRRPRLAADVMRELWGTSSWMMVSQAGTMLFLGIDMLVANRMLGATVAGAYGAVLVWSTFLRGIASAGAAVVTPLALGAEASSDDERMTELMCSAIRLLGMGIGLPVFVVAGFSADLLRLWAGDSLVDMSWVLTALVGHLALNLSVLPLFSLQLAKNRVRLPGIVTLVTGFVNVALAVALAPRLANGVGIALAGALVLTMKNALFTPLYAAHIQGVPKSTYFRELGRIVGLVSVFTGASIMIARAGWSASPLLLVIWIAVGTVAYGGAAWAMLGARERALLRNIVGLLWSGRP